ncbi:MAG: hypothetical protein ACOC8P_00340 [Dichotomicrobium sp.]
MTQYDFLALTVSQTGDIVELDQGDNTVHATVHQLPDLIRTLQRIHAETQADMARGYINQIREDLEKRPGNLRPVNGQGPKGAA